MEAPPDTPPADDRPPTGPLVTTRTALVLALLVALPSLLGAGLWAYAAEHQVVPGLDGCRLVRERAPQIACYTGEMRELVRADGLEVTLATIDEVALEQPTLAADCHLAWHPIGEAAGTRAARTKGRYANIEPATICQEGYFHGYSIGYLVTAPTGALDIPALVADQCSVAAKVDRDVLNCVHSFGHVIARRQGTDLAAATASCARPPYGALPFAGEPGNAAAYRFQCYYGLFMEVSLIDLKEGSAVLDNCSDAPGGEVARRACYSYLSARVGAMRDGLADGARACHELAPEGAMRDACVTTFAQSLNRSEQCSSFPARAEQALCRRNVGGDAIT